MSRHKFPPKPDTADVATVSFELPDEALRALDLSASEAGVELRLAAAMKLFELGRLSSGAAANLAGIPRVVFLTKLGEYGVDTFDSTEDELGKDAENA
jgi:predicted HTH domain antitoxin